MSEYENKIAIKQYSAICISGGGIYGSYILGMLHYINDFIDIENIRYYFGTSVGSLICLLLVIGYKPIEILTYVCSEDISAIFNFDLLNVSKNYGIYNINNLKNYVEKIILKKLNFIPNFADLYDIYDKYFLCCSYCITKKTRDYYSHITTPTLSVLEAIVRSCSIPFILTKCISEENIFVDGCVFDHFPIVRLIKILQSENKNHSNKKIQKILGIKVSSNNNNKNITSYSDYVSSILNIFIDVQHKDEDNELVNEYVKLKLLDIIELNKEFSFTLIDNTKKRIENFCEGINIAKEYYNRKIKIKLD